MENASPSTCLRVIDPARLSCTYQVVASLGSPSLFSLPALQSILVLISRTQSIAAVIEMHGPTIPASARPVHLSSKSIGQYREDMQSMEICSSLLTSP